MLNFCRLTRGLSGTTKVVCLSYCTNICNTNEYSAELGVIMKIKTSITLSKEIVQKIDQLSSFYGNRSALIEKAVSNLIKAEEKRQNDLKDLEILNQNAEILNDEADDVLSYQVEL